MLVQTRKKEIGAIFLVVEVWNGLLEHVFEILETVECAEFLGKFCQLDAVDNIRALLICYTHRLVWSQATLPNHMI
jgi:hypothetical protein